MDLVRQLLADLFRGLEELEVPYVVGGSFASGAWGVPRQTNDLDIALLLRTEQVRAVMERFGTHFSIDEREVLNTLASPDEYRSFQMLHLVSVFKVDVFVPPDSDYVRSEFARARRIDLVPDIAAVCLAPENIILRKLRWFDLGNRISDRQWNDIVQVVEIQLDNLDRIYLLKWTEHFGLTDLLKDAVRQVRA